MRTRRRLGELLARSSFSLAALCATAHASPPPVSIAVGDQTGGLGESNDVLGNIEKDNYLLGDMFGLRPALSRYGMTLSVQETSEVLGNATGGVHQGADYDGLTQAILQLDTQRAFGWHGGLFNISALQIHGRSLSADNLDSLQTASGIEADRATRLWEMWYQQKFLRDDRLDIKIGLQSADQEFIVNPNGAYFLNTMFGWPVVPSYDLPGGGPAYPLSAPAIRVRWRPADPVAILVGVFSGSPASNNQGDSQAVNASGTQFPLNQGPMVLAELQYTYPSLGGMVDPSDNAEPLGHTYKIGFWYNAESFADEAIDNTGGLLASPNSTGIARNHRGDYSIYAVADQMVWRAANNPNQSVSVFGRAMGTPQSDRNLVDYSANGGVVWHAPLRGRLDDTVGFGLGYAHVSGRAAALDKVSAIVNQEALPGTYSPIRSSETFLEATYQYQVFAWLQLQPDLQYVFNPGGGVQDSSDSTHRVRNELVMGVRTNILF